MFRTPAALVALLVVALAAGGCSSSPGTGSGHFTTPVAVASPSSSPSASTSTSPAASPSPSSPATSSPFPVPPAATGSFGVLAGPFSGANYNITLVGVDARIAASVQASTPALPRCGGQSSGNVPYPVSTSSNAAYFMDATGAVRWISPTGAVSSSPVMTLPVGPSTRSVFAVQPGGYGIAVAVIDFNQSGATTRLFVDNLPQSSAQNLIFTETGSYTLWPIGWTGGGDLVVAKVVACTQGGGPFCCGPQELHVVSGTTAVRRSTLGGSGCVIAGPASPGGVVCENSTFSQANQINWQGATVNSFPVNGPAVAFISPDSNLVAVVSTGTGVTNVRVAVSLKGIEACEWIDNNHLLSGGDAQTQPRVGDVSSGLITPVAAQGDCAGRIPGVL